MVPPWEVENINQRYSEKLQDSETLRQAWSRGTRQTWLHKPLWLRLEEVLSTVGRKLKGRNRPDPARNSLPLTGQVAQELGAPFPDG